MPATLDVYSASRRRIAGIYGNSNRDEYLQAKRVEGIGETVRITWLDGSSTVVLAPAVAGKSTLAAVPDEFRRSVYGRRAGGGGTNSGQAAVFITSQFQTESEIRILDANNPHGVIGSEMPLPYRTLNLRYSPCNYVVGDRKDKRVFRCPIPPGAPLGTQQLRDVHWLCEADCMLVNSPKDEEPVARIVEQRSNCRFELILVITPSLPAEFWKRVALPAADVVVGAWDELQFLTGESAIDIEGAALTASRLRRIAPEADIHITMGKRGVISTAAASAELLHTELTARAGIAAKAQEIAERHPARLCGAGDAFAAGVLVRRAFGYSLTADANFSRTSHIQDALAGCASALAWIGVSDALRVSAFETRRVPQALGA